MRKQIKPATFAVAFALAVFSMPSLADKAPDAAQLERGKTLFKSAAVPACAICHALKDAGATGAIGPDLDELKPGYAAVVQVVKNGLGVMPAFASTLSEDDINAVAAYVVHATGATP